MGVGVAGIELDSAPELELRAVDPAVASDDDAEIIPGAGVVGIVENGLGQCRERLVEAILIHINNTERQPGGGGFHADPNGFFEKFLGGGIVAGRKLNDPEVDEPEQIIRHEIENLPVGIACGGIIFAEKGGIALAGRLPGDGRNEIGRRIGEAGILGGVGGNADGGSPSKQDGGGKSEGVSFAQNRGRADSRRGAGSARRVGTGSFGESGRRWTRWGVIPAAASLPLRALVSRKSVPDHF